jgi:hypothetical protein
MSSIYALVGHGNIASSATLVDCAHIVDRSLSAADAAHSAPEQESFATKGVGVPSLA